MEFWIGAQEGINIPLWTILGFQQRKRESSQNLNNDNFYRPPVTKAQCIIGTKNYPDSSILLNSIDDDYSQGYGQIKEAFESLSKDDTLTLFLTDKDFRSSNINIDIGFILYVFEMRRQKNSGSAQPIKVEFKFS